MKKDYEMTQQQLDEIMDACKPTPVMYQSGGKPMFNTPQENANYAWEKLGKELGFKHMTVEPNGKGDRFFSAEEAPKEVIKEADNELEQLKDKLKQAMAIIETITYIGTDWGHGKFELSEHHIKEARRFYEMYEDK